MCVNYLFVSFVIVGLQVKVKGEPLPLLLFNYCPAPMMTHTTRVDWRVISNEPIDAHHILCHQLQPQDNLQTFITSCNIELTRALILVTTDDSYLLSRDFMWEGMATPPFPVCVLNNTNGLKLYESMSHYDAGDLFANISSKTISVDDAMKYKSPSPEDLSLTLDDVKGEFM